MAFPPQIYPPPMDEAPLRHIPAKSPNSNPFGALAAPSGPRRHEVCIAPVRRGRAADFFGREGGRFSMEEMTELKWIIIESGQRAFPM